MPDMQYTYAVARIRAKELGLLNNQFIDQLMSAKTYNECLQMLIDKGWGDPDGGLDADAVFAAERRKTWELMGELVDDISVFDVFLYINDYSNLKAAIKLVCTDTEIEESQIFIQNGTVDPQLMLTALREKEFYLLPEHMRSAAEEAFQVLLHTQDGQLCDVIIDKAALEAVYHAGKEAGDELIADYAEVLIGVSDIKIAVRAQKTGKTKDFLDRALAVCNSLNVNTLSSAAITGFDAICDYLLLTQYASGVPYLQESPSAFERWCDNLIIEKISPQKRNAFTLGPLAAYVLARENELKTVRIILSGKLNNLPEESVRERLREMYA
jgi:V/A-type H+-transporting ATPase subunit C